MPLNDRGSGMRRGCMCVNMWEDARVLLCLCVWEREREGGYVTECMHELMYDMSLYERVCVWERCMSECKRDGWFVSMWQQSMMYVPQLHRLQEDIWPSLACRPVAGPHKLQPGGRTGSNHSGTIWELQQCTKQSTLVFQDNSKGCLSPFLIERTFASRT